MADPPDVPDQTAEPDVDPGEPITALAELRTTPAAGFVSRIRRRLQRAHLAADTSEFSWFGLSYVAVELLKVIAHAVQPGPRRKEDER